MRCISFDPEKQRTPRRTIICRHDRADLRWVGHYHVGVLCEERLIERKGAICSNLKSDKTAVRVKTDNAVYDTGIRKFGAALADNADVGCGCVLNPGTVVGKNTRIYPLVSVRGVIPADRIVKSAECLVKKEVRPCAE
mgnify:CR=1 FL=1